MKKLLIVLAVMFMLVGCSSDSNDKKETTINEEGFIFEVNGTAISMNEDTSSILEGLGKEISYYEAKSCAFEGLDKTYTYAGFQLMTYPKDDKDYVNSIVLKSDTVATQEGIAIGDTKAKVEEKYGKDFENKNGAYVYTKGKSTLEFIFTDDIVTSITYTAITK